jgi:hypothetical protein
MALHILHSQQTHVCPEALNLEAIVPATAEGMSASSKMIIGALLQQAAPIARSDQGNCTHPPSSMEIFFIVPMAFCASILPTLVLPVKLTFLMIGFVVNSCPTSCKFLSVVMMFRTPSGTPARLASYGRQRGLKSLFCVSPWNGNFRTHLQNGQVGERRLCWHLDHASTPHR